MDTSTLASTQSATAINPSTKRKRSLSGEQQPQPTPSTKTVKTHNNHLQINYLARQYPENLPLLSIEDTLPNILQLIGDYSGVLERHESMAGNLGAKPLGPILMSRFERIFDGPPKVLKTHGKEGTMVTWLDVVEFARHKPEQFNLEKMRDGVRVCQFYTKQSRVEITEDDYQLIASGMPQKLIPPQPIAEDEEKELGTLEIIEKNISQIYQMADLGMLSSIQMHYKSLHTDSSIVSARARQLNHRLKSRKTSIISRREAETTSGVETVLQSPLVANAADKGSNGEQRSSQSPTSGFVAVNRPSTSHDSTIQNGYASSASDRAKAGSGSIKPAYTASAATRAELLTYFSTPSAHAGDHEPASRPSGSASRNYSSSKPKSKATGDVADYAAMLLNSTSPVPIPHTPSNLLHFNRPSPADRFDDSGPYKAEMLARMDQLQRGDRVLPPCDRCRRLHMDCLKNLTACQGCTKKHAKCSWKDVTDQELRDNPYVPRSEKEELSGAADSPEIMSILAAAAEEGPKRSVRDEELLGEDASDDYVPASPKEQLRGPEPPDQVMGEVKPHEARANEEPRDVTQILELEDRMYVSV